MLLKDAKDGLVVLGLGHLLVERYHLMEHIVELGRQLHLFRVQLLDLLVLVLVHHLEARVHQVLQIRVDQILRADYLVVH